jgi:hypothetical protein
MRSRHQIHDSLFVLYITRKKKNWRKKNISWFIILCSERKITNKNINRGKITQSSNEFIDLQRFWRFFFFHLKFWGHDDFLSDLYDFQTRMLHHLETSAFFFVFEADIMRKSKSLTSFKAIFLQNKKNIQVYNEILWRLSIILATVFVIWNVRTPLLHWWVTTVFLRILGA